MWKKSKISNTYQNLRALTTNEGFLNNLNRKAMTGCALGSRFNHNHDFIHIHQLS